jgi:molybdenum cofactor cytidylyltransferase
MSESEGAAAIILAAGSSSRMGAGRHKLLLPLAGRAVLAHVIEAALASQARPVLVVLGHQAAAVRTQLAADLAHPAVTSIENPHYLRGMSTSLRAGLVALIANGYRNIEGQPDMGGALIMLGDQPFITPHMLDTLISTWQRTGRRIVSCSFEGRRGNPTFFARSLFAELMRVDGDEGGRSVIACHVAEALTVEFGSAIASYDVDTWEAYQQVVQAYQQQAGRVHEP